jgi:hypothetical protein
MAKNLQTLQLNSCNETKVLPFSCLWGALNYDGITQMTVVRNMELRKIFGIRIIQ